MTKKSFIIGLPESGKTTFLGALAYTLNSCTTVDTMYALDKIENMDYMRELSETWSKCEKMSRTMVGNYERCTIFLKDRDDNKIELVLPDQSGEEFKNIIRNRTMSDKMYKDILDCDDILMFINPNVISSDIMITEISDKYRNGEELQYNGDINEIHEQAQYVMLLQDIRSVKRRKTKLKVIISAWDAYEEKVIPEELLKRRLPLVWQFLFTNHMDFECEYWGISAQGGDVTDSLKKEELLEYEDAVERIIVVQGDKHAHDLTAILK